MVSPAERRPWPLLLLTVLALSLAMVPQREDALIGVYSAETLAGAAAAGLLGLAATLLPPGRLWGPRGLGRWLPPGPWPLAALALLLSGIAVSSGEITLEYLEEAPPAVRWASLAGFLLTASLCVHLLALLGRFRLLFGVQVVLLFASGAAVRGAALAAVPDSGIDLHEVQRVGADNLLAGRNPYGAEYHEQDGRPMQGAPFYPPLPLLLDAPFRAAGLDIRLASLVCDVLAALVLFLAVGGGRARLSGAFLAAAYLHYPRVPLLLALAWYEPMLAACLGAGLLLVCRGYRAGHVLLGLGVTGKQVGVVLLPPLVRAFWPRHWALLAGLAVAVGATVLPFLLLNPDAFLHSVFWYHLQLPVRKDAVNFQAMALNEWGHELPRALTGGVTLLLVGLITWRTPSDGTSPAPWLAVSLIVFYLFHRHAAINYYYLCQYLLLLGLGDWMTTPHPRAEGARPDAWTADSSRRYNGDSDQGRTQGCPSEKSTGI